MKISIKNEQLSPEVIINATGIQERRSLSQKDQWDAGQVFVNAL